MNEERILFLTGKLAEKQLRQILVAKDPDFYYKVLEMGVKVAALMTTDWIAKRIEVPPGTGRVIVPGLASGPLEPIREATQKTSRGFLGRIGSRNLKSNLPPACA